MTSSHAAIDYFLSSFESTQLIAEVLCRKNGNAVELLHHRDAESGKDSATLKSANVRDLRIIAAHSHNGAFRPLKSAPTLTDGWYFSTTDRSELLDALDSLYPGFVADFHHFNRDGSKASQSYRQFTDRQTGMYRITQLISDEDLECVALGCCDAQFCLKSRQWSTALGTTDEPGTPSIVPCLEPCAPLLELARIQAKSRQADQFVGHFSERELDVIKAALQKALSSSGSGDSDIREAEVYNVLNPRRLNTMLAQINRLQPVNPKKETDANAS